MSGEGESRRVRIAVAIITLPLLYVLSSGLMRTVAFRCYIPTTPTPTLALAPASSNGSGRVGVDFDFPEAEDQGVWWPKVYAPLTWIENKRSWVGNLLFEYWMLFPIRER